MSIKTSITLITLVISITAPVCYYHINAHVLHHKVIFRELTQKRLIKSKTTDVGSEIGQEIAGNKLRPESQTPATIAYKDCLNVTYCTLYKNFFFAEMLLI